MSDVRRQSRSDDEIDISARPSRPSALNGLMRWAGWLGVILLTMILFTITPPNYSPWLLLVVPISVVAFAGVLLLLYTRWRLGAFTWMRLARSPARLRLKGDVAGAEAAFERALARADRFAAADHRRAYMLFELAGYAKSQGRSEQARTLYEETIAILARSQRAAPLDYFAALNNYAIYHIHHTDYQAAQDMLEKALDLTLVARKGEERRFVKLAPRIKGIEFVLHINLAFLFIEMNELGEANLHLDEAEKLLAKGSKTVRRLWDDHYLALRAILWWALDRLEDADAELAQVKNPQHAAVLRARAKLHLARQQFAAAERCLVSYYDQEKKKSHPHRPEMRHFNLELAECRYQQGRHAEAMTALQEALSLVADFKLRSDGRWRTALQKWLPRLREFGRDDLVAAIEAELQTPTVEAAIVVLATLRLTSRAPSEAD